MRRRRVFILAGLMVLVIVAGILWLSSGSGFDAPAILSQVPEAAQESAEEALQDDYSLVSTPLWAGPVAAGGLQGRYRLFFLAQRVSPPDLMAADVQVNAAGQVTRLLRWTALTDTPDGEETAPVACGEWLVYATRVAGRYQMLTCLSLRDLERQERFAFSQPAAEVELLDLTVATAFPLLEVVSREAGQETRLRLDLAALRAEPDETALTHLPTMHGTMPFLPNLVSRVRELPFVGPKPIAFAENVFFTVVDWVNRLRFGRQTPSLVAEAATPTRAQPLQRSPSRPSCVHSVPRN